MPRRNHAHTHTRTHARTQYRYTHPKTIQPAHGGQILVPFRVQQYILRSRSKLRIVCEHDRVLPTESPPEISKGEPLKLLHLRPVPQLNNPRIPSFRLYRTLASTYPELVALKHEVHLPSENDSATYTSTQQLLLSCTLHARRAAGKLTISCIGAYI